MTNQFDGKTALVTVGGSGISKAVALSLATEDANVLVNDFNFDRARTTREQSLASGGTAKPVRGDVGNPPDVKAAVDACRPITTEHVCSRC